LEKGVLSGFIVLCIAVHNEFTFATFIVFSTLIRARKALLTGKRAAAHYVSALQKCHSESRVSRSSFSSIFVATSQEN
jgi:hypothetical protein